MSHFLIWTPNYANGFELTFTQPVDPKTAGDIASYKMRCWTHMYYSNYGDKRHEERDMKIVTVTVGKDNKSVILELDKVQPYFIHALFAAGVRSADDLPLLHNQAYYTVNRVPKP